jgi:O-antigen/teichoic acid export membrane protein
MGINQRSNLCDEDYTVRSFNANVSLRPPTIYQLRVQKPSTRCKGYRRIFLFRHFTNFVEQLSNFWRKSPTIRNILKVSLGDATSKVFSVAIAFLLIRNLSIGDYANYTTFSGVSYLFSGIVGAGINMALVRFAADQISHTRKRPEHVYFLAIFAQLVIYIVLAATCLLFPTKIATILFGQAALALPLGLGLVSGLGLLMLQFARTVYQAAEEFNKYIGTIWLVQTVIFSILAILWQSKQLSFLPSALTFAAVQLGIGLWLLLDYLRYFDLTRLKNGLLDQKHEVRQFIIGSGWLIGYFLMLNLFSRMDVLMLLHFKGKEELAIYGVAFQYYSLSLLFLGSIHAVLLPRFAKVEMQDTKKQISFLRQWLRWSVWLALPIGLFDVFGKSIFVWLNGGIYERSFPIFIIFSIGIWLSMMFSPLVNILISRGEYRFLFILSLLAFVFNIVGNLLLVPRIGGAGAALVIILTQNILVQIPILLKGLQQI